MTVPTGAASGPGCCAMPDVANPPASTIAPVNMPIAGRQRRRSRMGNRDHCDRSFGNWLLGVLIGRQNPAADGGCVDAAGEATATRSSHDADFRPAQVRVEQLVALGAAA